MTMHQEDSELREMLRSAADAPPHDDVDWRALQARIELRAAPLLRQPATSAWWQQVARWSGRGIPLGAAAAAALMIALGTDAVETGRTTPAPAAPAQVTFRTIEEELADAAPLLLAEADSDQLIEAMLLYNGGEW